MARSLPGCLALNRGGRTIITFQFPLTHDVLLLTFYQQHVVNSFVSRKWYLHSLLRSSQTPKASTEQDRNHGYILEYLGFSVPDLLAVDVDVERAWIAAAVSSQSRWSGLAAKEFLRSCSFCMLSTVSPPFSIMVRKRAAFIRFEHSSHIQSIRWSSSGCTSFYFDSFYPGTFRLALWSPIRWVFLM